MPFLEICLDSDLKAGQSVGNWVMSFAPNVFGDKRDNLQIHFTTYHDEGRENCKEEEELMISKTTALYLRDYLTAFLTDCEQSKTTSK